MTTKLLTIIALTSILITTIFAQSQMASALDTTTTMIAPIPPVNVGSQISLSVTVTDMSNQANLPTGSVTWTDHSNIPGSFSGGGICTLIPGTSSSQCQITYTASSSVPLGSNGLIVATYSGDSNDAGSQMGSPITFIAPPPSNTAQGSVTILGTCGIAVSPTSINFGQTLPGNTPVPATNNPIVLTNNGNTPASPVTVIGTNWMSGMTVGIEAPNTQFSLTAAGPFMPLSPAPPAPVHPMTVTQSLAQGSPLNTYWQLIPLTTTNQISGQLTQTLTFSGGC